MIIVSENAFWVTFWADARRQKIKIVSKWRKNRGAHPYTALAYRDKMGRIVVASKFPVPVNVKSWCSKALQRGFRYR